MATVLGSLLVELGMDSAQFDRGIDRAQRNMQSATRSFQNSARQINQSSGAMRGGMQQLSFQLNDVATQWASGTKPMQIFAQQSGQVVQAVALMSNGAGKFGAFMAGPWGMALTAGVVVLGALASKLGDTSGALEKVQFASNAVGDAQGILGNVMDLTTGKINTQNKALIALAQAQILVAKVQAQARAAEARRGVQAIQDRPLRLTGSMMGASLDRRAPDARDAISRGVLSGALDGRAAIQRLENLRRIGQITDEQFSQASQSIANLGQELANLKAYEDADALLNGRGGTSLLKPGKTDKTGKTASGPTEAEIGRRFNDELSSIARQTLSARQSLALSAGEEAELALRAVELARIRTIEGIKADKDYSAAQKKRLLNEVESLADAEREKIERDKQRRIDQETTAAKQQEHEARRDALGAQLATADTEAERQRLALEMLALDQEYKRNLAERVLASKYATDAEKAQAQRALDALNANAVLERNAVSRQTETTAQAYLRNLNKTPEQINEAIDNIKIGALESFNDQLVDAIVNFKSLGDVAQSVFRQILAEMLRLQIQSMLIKPLAGMLGLGGGGGIGSVLGVASSFSPSSSLVSSANSTILSNLNLFAEGTNFAPGGLAIVGERGPELMNVPRASGIMNNSELKSLIGGRGTTVNLTMLASGNPQADRQSAQQAALAIRRELNGPVR